MTAKNFTAKRLAIVGLLTAAALIAFIVENLFPPIFPVVPFVRLGLSNLFVLLALTLYGRRAGALAMLVKILLGSLFSGRIASLPVGLAGGVTSFFVMALLCGKLFPSFSLIGISAAGSAVGNFFRTAMTAAMTGTGGLMLLSPYTVLFGVLTGAVLGAAAQLILRVTPEKFWIG